MKKFTQEEIIKKHQTNVKSAFTAALLAGALGLIFVVRYLIKGDFDFYFSFGFTETVLRLFDEGTLTVIPTALLVCIFLVCYLFFGAMSMKKQKWFYALLGLYIFDFFSLGVMLLAVLPKPIAPEAFIDVIVHGFITLFLIVGIRSHRWLEEKGLKAE